MRMHIMPNPALHDSVAPALELQWCCLQHHPVYTIGKRGRDEDFKVSKQVCCVIVLCCLCSFGTLPIARCPHARHVLPQALQGLRHCGVVVHALMHGQQSPCMQRVTVEPRELERTHVASQTPSHGLTQQCVHSHVPTPQELQAQGVDVFPVPRGGEVTWHGAQLMM